METASRGLTTGGHIIIGLPGDFSATMSLSGGSPSGWRKWRLR
jgi:hypothetical protein